MNNDYATHQPEFEGLMVEHLIRHSYALYGVTAVLDKDNGLRSPLLHTIVHACPKSKPMVR